MVSGSEEFYTLIFLESNLQVLCIGAIPGSPLAQVRIRVLRPAPSRFLIRYGALVHMVFQILRACRARPS